MRRACWCRSQARRTTPPTHRTLPTRTTTTHAFTTHNTFAHHLPPPMPLLPHVLSPLQASSPTSQGNTHPRTHLAWWEAIYRAAAGRALPSFWDGNLYWPLFTIHHHKTVVSHNSSRTTRTALEGRCDTPAYQRQRLPWAGRTKLSGSSKILAHA